MRPDNKKAREFLISNLYPYKKHIVLLFFLLLLASVFDGVSIGMLVPLLGGLQEVKNYDQLPDTLQTLADIFAKYPIQTQIYLSLAFVVAAVLLKNLFLIISRYLSSRIVSWIISSIRAKLVNTLMFVGIGYYNKVKNGELVDKIVLKKLLTEEIVRQIFELIDNIISFSILIVLLIIFSWKMTLVSIIMAVLIGFGVSIYIRRLAILGQRVVNSGRELTGSVQESLSGVEVIKSFTRENERYQYLKDKIEKHADTTFQLKFADSMVHIITEALGIIAIAILFIIAITRSDMDYRLLLTQLLPFIYILSRMLPLIKMINHSRGVIEGRLPALEAVYDLSRTDNKPYVKDGPNIYQGLQNSIRFDSVSFSYNYDDQPALDNVTFEIQKGKTTAIVGKSGAGKSTVINLLLKLYDPLEGAILIDGGDLRELNTHSYRNNIGVVTQDTFIFSDTVKNNIAFGSNEDTNDEAIKDAAKRAGADEFIKELPSGYDTLLGERGVNLSGGQKQRISIARAILKNPEILILDEATSSLDTQTERLIHNAIIELSRDRTVVIIAHRLSTVRAADRIIVLRDGELAEAGTEDELLMQKGEYYELARANVLLDDSAQ